MASNPVRLVVKIDGMELAVAIRRNEDQGIDMKIGNRIMPMTSPQALMLGKALVEMAEPLVEQIPPPESEEGATEGKEEEEEDTDEDDEYWNGKDVIDMP